MQEDQQNPSAVTVENIGAQQAETIDIQLRMDAKELTGFYRWARFRAIYDIVMGVLACLGFITAVYGIFLIIGGVKLMSATTSLKLYMENGQEAQIANFFFDHKKFFVFSGISVIIRVIFFILLFVLYIAIIALFITSMGSPFDVDTFFLHLMNVVMI